MIHAHASRSSVANVTGFAHPPRNVKALGIEPGMVVADFGAGSGAYVIAIAETLANTGKVYAIDIQKDLLRRIHNEAHRKGLSSVHILWGDLEATHGSKLADHICDFVLISNLLFQVEEKEAVIREAQRILRPRGRLAIIDWEDMPNPLPSARVSGLGPLRSHVLKKEDAIALAQKAGFTYAEEFNAGAHHYGVIFRAKTNQ